MNFKFGLDPEFFIVDKNQKNISATSILPVREKSLKYKGSEFYYDNALSEIAIKPSKSKDGINKNIKTSIKKISEYVFPHHIEIKSFGEFSKEELSDPEARISSCVPEWDVYSLSKILPPDEDVALVGSNYEFITNNRSAGGHIHVGSNVLVNNLDSIFFVKMMDLFVGIPSLFIQKEECELRRKIYGKAGSHRIKDYGMEYRVLSNFWLSSPDLVSLVYDLTEFTLNFTKNKKYKKFWSVNQKKDDLSFDCHGYDIKRLQNTINESKIDEAEYFMNIIKNYIPNKIYKKIRKKYSTDFKKNWNL